MNTRINNQNGASLIEVLIAILILSFGLLALGGMLSASVQMPKFAAYRATATNLAASHVERIRANSEGFVAGSYTTQGTAGTSGALNEVNDWSFTAIALAPACTYTGTQCTTATLAQTDINEFRSTVRRELPAGDTLVTCSTSPCAKTSFGELWVIWQEPETLSALDATAADNCPTAIAAFNTAYIAANKPRPRCLYVRFKVE